LHSDDSLYVNLFIASELSWPDKGLTVRQDTKFPDQDTTRLTFRCRQPVKLALKIRWPAWAETISVRVNGWKQKIPGAPGSYVAINRQWSDGDRVELQLPMKLHLESLPGTTNLFAVLYGPIVLAGELGTNGMPADPYAQDQTKFVKWPPVPVPVLVADNDSILKHIQATRRPLTFRTKNLGHPEDVTLVPFYRVPHQRYAVYWHVLSPTEWRLQESSIKTQWDQTSARLTAWEEKTVAQPEGNK
jgi:uncharacterized protein